MKTNNVSKIVVVSALAFLGLVLVGSISMATSQDKENKILDKVSTESNAAVHDLRSARLSLFEGQTEAAQKYLTDGKKNLQAAEKQAPELIVTVNSQKKVGDKTVSSKQMTETSDYVPINAWLTLSEDFVATPEKQETINKANEHLKNGDKNKAVEVLRSADISVSVSRALMPLKETMAHVEKAISLMNDHKYYEANLALKSAEDGLIVDSVLLVDPADHAKIKGDTKTSNG